MCRFLCVFFLSGESGLGKSTLINSLFLTDLYSAEYPGPSNRIKKTVKVSGLAGLVYKQEAAKLSTNDPFSTSLPSPLPSPLLHWSVLK